MPETTGREDFEIPLGYEFVGTILRHNGGADILIAIERPDEWRDQYPDALQEARADVSDEIDDLFDSSAIPLSEFRRLEAEEQQQQQLSADGDVPTESTATTPTRRRRPRNDPLTLTVEEAGDHLGISRALAYEAVRRGEIPAIKIGRRILIPKAALNRLLESVESSEDSAQR